MLETKRIGNVDHNGHDLIFELELEAEVENDNNQALSNIKVTNHDTLNLAPSEKSSFEPEKGEGSNKSQIPSPSAKTNNASTSQLHKVTKGFSILNE